MSERIRRLLVNSALFGVAAAAGVIYGAEEGITLAIAIAAGAAFVRAALGGIVIVRGWVTPGNPILVNMGLAFVGNASAALIVGGTFSRAAGVAAIYAGTRAVAGLFLDVSDHPQG